jgi:hypothetical protein
VWTAADAVPGLRARRCRVRRVGARDPAEPADDEPALGRTLVDVDLTVVVDAGTSVPAAAEQLRRRVVGLVDTETGLEVRRVDLTVEDLL